MSTITYSGVSSDTLGIMVNQIIVPPSSVEEYEMIKIPGRPEPLRSNLKTRPPIQIEVEATIVEDNVLRQIYSTFQGTGKLIRSTEPDKYYNASAQVITPENIARYMHKITLGFECMPFAYAVSNDPVELEISGSAATIDVGGGYYCQPIYKIYGSGDITLTVNGTGNPLKLYEVDEYVTVDTAVLICHKNGAHVKNSGKLPFLSPGTNMLSWSSNATAVEVIKNERWL